MPDGDYNDCLSQAEIDECINKFPLLFTELTVLRYHYKIISISHDADFIFTIEFNDKITNEKYKPRIVDSRKDLLPK